MTMRSCSLCCRVFNKAALMLLLLLLFSICGLIFLTRFSYWERAVTTTVWWRSHMLLNKAASGGLNSTTIEEYPEPAINRTVREDTDPVLEALPNLPLSYHKNNNPHFPSGNKSCGQYPPLFDISFNNIYWQVLQTSNVTFYLLSASYDNRTLSKTKPSLRIVTMVNHYKPTVKIHCQIWFDNKSFPIISNVTDYQYIWKRSWGYYKGREMEPYLLECVVPAEHRHEVPQSVSLVQNPCHKPTNNLRIVNNQPEDGQKKNFAVCVKGLDFPSADLSVRIIEWLELVFLLGADKVFLYNLGIHPNISKVLDYYQSLGRVDVRELTLPGQQPNFRGLLHRYLNEHYVRQWKNEVLPYNDCFYRNMNLYKFIVLIDIDEVIVPKRGRDWRSLLEQVEPRAMAADTHTRSSYCAPHVYFLDSMQEAHGHNLNIPPYLHMMQHVYRSAAYNLPRQFDKCFFNTECIVTVFNHHPMSCFDHCNVLLMPVEHAQMNHYRKDCVFPIRSKCPFFKNQTVFDNRLWIYKKNLTKNVQDALLHLGFLE
ncbi:uncharacterized protein [Procambarus clarkii]|uniref:uncharacterized protein n=1 Tax=Procambarus clarkii TaxID=6728 RepID=UPI001E67377C|nr:uncharacterized protein LOC123761729 [Procambarus clarkii]XP_045603851.1 uncharacterized protein LOC123761729 [Procambarus clarkii]